jgi:hypothetical protein
VRLIVDNYATHKHEKTKLWLAQRPRYHVHFTPTYSSWLNQVDIWFHLITQKTTRRGSFQSAQALIEKIGQFVQTYNRNHAARDAAARSVSPNVREATTVSTAMFPSPEDDIPDEVLLADLGLGPEDLSGSDAKDVRDLLDEEKRNRWRYLYFRIAAECVAAALSRIPAVQKVALIGSVAAPPVKVPPFSRRLRRLGIKITRECGDIDLAVWVSDLTALPALQKARGRAANDFRRETDYGVAHHQIEIFVMQPGTDEYLGCLCIFSACPKDWRKPECRVEGCGATPFLQRHADFTLYPDVLSPAKSVVLFERRA